VPNCELFDELHTPISLLSIQKSICGRPAGFFTFYSLLTLLIVINLPTGKFQTSSPKITSEWLSNPESLLEELSKRKEVRD